MAVPDRKGAAGGPRPRAPSGQLIPLKVTVCAWCERRAVRGIWDDIEIQIMPLTERHLVTHGICPECFHDRATGTPYPEN